MQKNRTCVRVTNRVRNKFWKIMRLGVFILFSIVTKSFATETYSQSARLNLKMEDAKVTDVGTKADQQQTKKINGKVTDASGKPIPGATIVIKGTTKGVISDADGKYVLSILPGNASILFSFVGMKNQEIPVSGKTEINVVMEDDVESLDEVVVTGYGNFKKASFTGSASTVNTEKLRDIPVVSIEQKLQGQSSGVFITSTSGQPAALPTIRIRGMGSFSASNDPLYIIDGVPVATGSMSNTAGYMNDAKTSIMSTINPDDVENITVIKDAAAASLYGSRAANGVILITTKKGKAGKPNVNLKISSGVSDLAVTFRPMLSGQDRRDLINESFVNYATDNHMADPAAYAASQIDTYAPKPWSGYTNWNDYLLRRKAYASDYQGTISGGDEKSNFAASAGYTKQEGIAINSDLQRYSTHLNYNRKVTNKLDFGGNFIFSQVSQNQNEERTSSIAPFFLLAGYATPSDYPYNPDGSYHQGMIAEDSGLTPVRDMKLDIANSTLTRLFTTGMLGYEIIDGLKVKENLTYDYTIQKDKQYFNPYSYAGQHAVLGVAQTNKSFTEYANLFSSTSLGYLKKINKVHNIDALIAYEIQDFRQDNLAGGKQNIASDQLTELDAASTILSTSSSPSEYRLLSYISRLNYDYNGKYYLGGSFRRDGTSRLAPGQCWGNFWSVSGMWRLIDESFMSGIKEVFTDLKFRSSYGVNGNLPTSFYAYQGLYSYSKSYQGQLGSYESSLSNPNLKWEKNYNLNMGIDFTLYNRVSVTAEYYSRQTKDLLFSLPLSYTSGFTTRTGNIGQISNKGLELEINSTNIKSNDFQWTTNLSLSHNSNVVKKITDQLTSTTVANRFALYIPTVGGPYYEFYLKEFAGVDRNNGSALYYLNTKKSDGTLDKTTTSNVASAQAVDVGKQAMPDLTANLTNTLLFKAFDLGFTFVGSWGGYTFDYLAHYFDVDGKNPERNYPAYVKNRWQKPGDITNIPRYVAFQNANNVPQNSTRYLHDADYIRLKTLSFGYTLPENLTKKVYMNRVRLYFSGSNLWTSAAWKNYDPEQPIGGFVFASTPVTRTFCFGADINF